MSEKNKKHSYPDESPYTGERPKSHILGKLIAIGSVGLTAFGITELALHSPSFNNNEQSHILEHDFTAGHWVEHSYGKFSVPSWAPDRYQLKVSQHEPDKIGADGAGNVTFEVTVDQATYTSLKDGETVDQLPGAAHY